MLVRARYAPNLGLDKLDGCVQRLREITGHNLILGLINVFGEIFGGVVHGVDVALGVGALGAFWCQLCTAQTINID